jgi:hypothetical protein
LNAAHCQGKLGKVPLEETLVMRDADEPNEAPAKLLIVGMEILVRNLIDTL